VRGLRIVVVPGAVEVHRQQVDRVEPVLLAVGLCLDEQHLLGDAVRRVGLLGVAVPEVVLVERHRGVLRVGADRPDRHELPDPGPASVLHQERAHDQIVVEEPAGSGPVGPDAADDRRQVDDHVGAGVLVQPGDRGLGGEVVLPPPRHHDVPAAPRSQRVHDVAAEEAGATGHENPAFRQLDHAWRS
jgi:hypothetical protein